VREAPAKRRPQVVVKLYHGNTIRRKLTIFEAKLMHCRRSRLVLFLAFALEFGIQFALHGGH
jgi:hypothetical protein